jgi:hypothetical protein
MTCLDQLDWLSIRVDQPVQIDLGVPAEVEMMAQLSAALVGP